MIKRLILLAAGAATLLTAQDADTLSGWQFYKEVLVSAGNGLATIELDAEALAGAKDDGEDLRLYDATGNEIPYALRVLRDVQTSERRAAEEFNRSTTGDIAAVTLDLGDQPGVHNQIEVVTAGANYRWRVSVLGSDDAEDWATLSERAMIFRFSSATRGVLVNRVRYPVNRFRFIRVAVSPDQKTASTAPVIESVTVHLAVAIRGQELDLPVVFGVREATRVNSRPASRYTIDLPGRLPIHDLRFTTPTKAFSREFRLESIEGENIIPVTVSSGPLVRPDIRHSDEITLRFREVFTPKLQLTVVDDRDPPLQLIQPVVVSTVRQVVVDLNAVVKGPLRLYYGNPSARAPERDVEVGLTGSLDEGVSRLFAGVQQFNANYQEPPPPLNERAPWLVYVVLGAVCLALLVILQRLVFDVDGDDETPRVSV